MDLVDRSSFRPMVLKTSQYRQDHIYTPLVVRIESPEIVMWYRGGDGEVAAFYVVETSRAQLDRRAPGALSAKGSDSGSRHSNFA